MFVYLYVFVTVRSVKTTMKKYSVGDVAQLSCCNMCLSVFMHKRWHYVDIFQNTCLQMVETLRQCNYSNYSNTRVQGVNCELITWVVVKRNPIACVRACTCVHVRVHVCAHACVCVHVCVQREQGWSGVTQGVNDIWGIKKQNESWF